MIRFFQSSFNRLPAGLGHEWQVLPTLAVFLILTLAKSQGSAAPVHLRSDVTAIHPVAELAVYQDSSAKLSFEAARNLYVDECFQTNQQRWPAFGFSRSAIWIHFDVQSDCPERCFWLAELQTARLDEVDWYFVRGTNVEHLQAGNGRARSAAVDNKFPIFPLRLNPGETGEIFMRVHSQTSVHVPLQLWDTTGFIAVEARHGGIFTLFFGYLAALILLSLVFSIIARDIGYVIYSLSLVGLFGVYFIMSGYYAWWHLPAVAWAVHQGVILAAESALLMLLLYLRYFFDLSATMPRLNRWVVRLTWVNGILAVLFLVGPYWITNQLLLLQGLLVGAVALGIACWNWWRGNRTARFYALAWLAFWTMFALTALQFKGWMPIPTMPELQVMLGIVVSVTLFFVAMADRVRQIRSSMEHSQARLLQMEQASALDLRRQMQQQQQIIRDLHDGVGGLAANIGILAEIGRRDSASGLEHGQFERIALLAAESSAEIHNLMSSLDARDLTWVDFVVECRRHGEMILEGQAVSFNLSVVGLDERPGPGLFPGLSLFRIFKEAITNIVKHSGARTVEVEMCFLADSFRLQVRDDGCGLANPRPAGRGMKNMAGRIQELGGTMTCQGEGGTTLFFELPLPLSASPANPK